MPVPVSDSTVGELAALLVNVIFADDAPVPWGGNFKVKGMLCPAARVKGNDTPLKEKSALVVVAEEIITLAPAAAKVAGKVLFVPTATLPKSEVDGATARVPAGVPVPDKVTIKLALV